MYILTLLKNIFYKKKCNPGRNSSMHIFYRNSITEILIFTFLLLFMIYDLHANFLNLMLFRKVVHWCVTDDVLTCMSPADETSWMSSETSNE